MQVPCQGPSPLQTANPATQGLRRASGKRLLQVPVVFPRISLHRTGEITDPRCGNMPQSPSRGPPRAELTPCVASSQVLVSWSSPGESQRPLALPARTWPTCPNRSVDLLTGPRGIGNALPIRQGRAGPNHDALQMGVSCHSGPDRRVVGRQRQHWQRESETAGRVTVFACQSEAFGLDCHPDCRVILPRRPWITRWCGRNGRPALAKSDL